MKSLNQLAKIERFPSDFMFQISAEEKAGVVTNCGHLGKLKYSRAFPLYRSHAPRPVLLTMAHILSGRGASEAAFPSGAWERSISPARSADKNLSSALRPLSSESGISLVELIMFIVIVSVGLAGIMMAMNTATKSSADPIIRKQALTIAESLLEEIEQKSFTVMPGNTRATFDDILDYNALNPASATYAQSSVAVPGLEGYSVTAVVISGGAATLPAIPPASAALITVTVNGPGGQSIEMAGYKVAH